VTGGARLLDFDYVEWDDANDPRGNVSHIADAGLTPEEVEDVLGAADADADTSDSTGRPVVFGMTPAGKYIIVVYSRTDENNVIVIRPITAYEVDPPQ
jgi:uncharacterized DUF497 family protein